MFSVINKGFKQKSPLIFDSENFNNKFELVNIIPKSSFLNVDEKVFICKGEVKNLIESKKRDRVINGTNNKFEKKFLTPFQKNEIGKNLIKDKIMIKIDKTQDKGILIKKQHGDLDNIDKDNLNFASNTCTILSYGSKKNLNNNLQEIIFKKLNNRNREEDKEKITSGNMFNPMNTTGSSKFFINNRFKYIII